MLSRDGAFWFRAGSGTILPMPGQAGAIGGNPATVKRHVMKARTDGYLTPTSPGKEGGHPTPLALEIVEAHNEQVLALLADHAEIEPPFEPLQRIVEEKPKRRYPRKAVTTSTTSPRRTP